MKMSEAHTTSVTIGKRKQDIADHTFKFKLFFCNQPDHHVNLYSLFEMKFRSMLAWFSFPEGLIGDA